MFNVSDGMSILMEGVLQHDQTVTELWPPGTLSALSATQHTISRVLHGQYIRGAFRVVTMYIGGASQLRVESTESRGCARWGARLAQIVVMGLALP